MDNVPDFLILDSLYKKSLKHQWKVNQRFCSYIDGEYWQGTIKDKKPFKYAYNYVYNYRVMAKNTI